MSDANGSIAEVSGNRPLRLDDAAEALVVEAGRLDLFAVGSRDGEPVGSRRRLFSVPAGGACAGGSLDEGRILLAAGVPGTRVRRMPTAGLTEEQAQGHARRVADLISEPKAKVFEAHYRPEDPRGSVAVFAGLLRDWIRERAVSDEASEREALRRKAALNERLYRGALVGLAGVLGGGTDAAADSAAEDPLTAATRLVADALGATLRAADAHEAEGQAASFRLEALCRASRIRLRRVALRGEWWGRDSGALLAFLTAPPAEEGASAPEPRPVAILPGRRGPEIVDPADASRRPVDAASAATLDPFAYQLYKPFPDRALGLTDLFSFLGRDLAPDAATAAAMAVLGALLGVVPALVTGKLFESVIPNSERGALLALSIALIASAVSAAVFSLTQSLALLRLEGKWDAGVQAALWDRLLRLPAPFFREYSVGDLAARAMSINRIRQAFGGATTASLIGGFQGLFNLGLLFYYDAALAGAALLLAAGAVAFYSACLFASLRLNARRSEIDGRLSGLVFQLLGGISKLRVAAAESRAFAVWSGLYAESTRVGFRAELSQVWIRVFNGILPVGSSMLVYWLAAERLHPTGGTAATMNLGQFAAFTAAFTAFLASSIQMSTTAFTLLDVIPVWKRSKAIFETLPEVDESRLQPGRLAGSIDFHRVSFRYRADGPKILDDVSFTVAPGEFVALVGPSGSGKSTILRLLLGFETPETGAIYYDGKDVAKLDVSAVRRQIGVVLQNGRLLAGDIFSNIVGNLPLTHDDAWAAAEAAGVAEDIREMPMGLQTVVSEGGSTLSGGQRQRLIIARALVRRPSNIFFDEATSALDNRTQAMVSESLEKLRATRVVIAHRLSTVRNADRIVVLKDGRVIQQGSYDALMAEPGLFRDLASRQIS